MDRRNSRRRVASQGLKVNSTGGPAVEKFFDHPTPMDESTIPNNQRLVRDMSHQALQKIDHRWPSVGLFLNHHVEFTFSGDATDGGKMVMGQILSDHRSLPPGRISPQDQGQQVEPRLINPHHSTSFGYRLFLSSGQRTGRLVVS